MSYKYQFTLGIGFPGAKHQEILDVCKDLGEDRNEWDRLSESEKNEKLEQHWQTWMVNYLDGGFWPVDSEK